MRIKRVVREVSTRLASLSCLVFQKRGMIQYHVFVAREVIKLPRPDHFFGIIVFIIFSQRAPCNMFSKARYFQQPRSVCQKTEMVWWNIAAKTSAISSFVNLHCVLLCQFALSSQVGEELTAWDVRHQEVEIARVLREALQSDLKR